MSEQKKLRVNVSIDIGHGDVDKSVRELLGEFLDNKPDNGGAGSNQEGDGEIHSDNRVGAGPVELATDKQKKLMKKLKISFDGDTSKDEASRFISAKFEENKKDGD